ncbi:MAG: hypothetical protein LBQ37_02125 [Elusimicrobiota bacterium]|jgi:hypothetical protein|nr:hypothetical protein [Elusimicrobiota bacterium]
MDKVAELIDELTSKLQSAVKNMQKLKEENKSLSLELNFLEKENEKNRKIANSYEALKKNVESAAIKIDRLLKKIDTSKG